MMPAALREWPNGRAPSPPSPPPPPGAGGGMPAPIAVPVEDGASLTLASFEERYVRPNRPVVVRGALSRWAPLSRWTDEYLRATVGARVVPCRTNPQGGEGGEGGRLYGDITRMQSYQTEDVPVRL